MTAENPEQIRDPVSETTRWGFIGEVRSAVRDRAESNLSFDRYQIVITREPTMVVISDDIGNECRFTITGIGADAEISQWVGGADEEPGHGYESATEEMTAWARTMIRGARNG